MEIWKAARQEYAAAHRRMWTTAIVLGPLSFAGLALLNRAQCPLPMDFLTLGGASAAMLLLWIYLAERCQVEREAASQDLRAAEAILGMRPAILETASADRMVRVILSVVFVVLWGWSWTVRPDCTSEPVDESDLTTLPL